jgi:hypothetical protein
VVFGAELTCLGAIVFGVEVEDKSKGSCVAACVEVMCGGWLGVVDLGTELSVIDLGLEN